MKKTWICGLLALIILLSACQQNEELPAEGSEDVSEIESQLEDSSTDGEDNPKKLTDTDYPDKAQRIKLTFDSYDRLGNKYVDGNGLGALYDGNINTRIGYHTYDTKTSFNAAKFEQGAEVEYIKLFCSENYQYNIGLQLQLSADGSEYTTVYTLTEEDAENLEKGPIVITVNESALYSYFRIYQKDSATGYDLNEVEIYSKRKLITVQRSLDLEYQSYDGSSKAYISDENGTSTKTEETFKRLSDGDTSTAVDYYPFRQASASFAVYKLSSEAKISRIDIYSSSRQDGNEDLQIQGSSDGESWSVLYTVLKKDVDLMTESGSISLDLSAQDMSVGYIRLYQPTQKRGFCINEMRVYETAEIAESYGTVSAKAHDWKATESKFLYAGKDLSDVWSGSRISWYPYTKKEEGLNKNNGYAYTAAELGEECLIGKIEFVLTTKKENISRNNGLKIQISMDGKTYTDIYTISPADTNGADNGKFTVFLDVPITAKYIRLYASNGVGMEINKITVHKINM